MITDYSSPGGPSGVAKTAGKPATLEGSYAPTASSNALYVVPHDKGDGFQAVVRGHILELADPDSNHGLAPTPSDLLVASFSAAVAWSARTFLRASELPDDVSVSATWRMLSHLPRPDEIELAVTVPRMFEAEHAALAAALANTVPRAATQPVMHLSVKGVNQ